MGAGPCANRRRSSRSVSRVSSSSASDRGSQRRSSTSRVDVKAPVVGLHRPPANDLGSRHLADDLVVARLAQRPADADVVAGLLEHLAHGALDLRLAGPELSLRQAPVVVARPMDDRDLDAAAVRRRNLPFATDHAARCADVAPLTRSPIVDASGGAARATRRGPPAAPRRALRLALERDPGGEVERPVVGCLRRPRQGSPRGAPASWSSPSRVWTRALVSRFRIASAPPSGSVEGRTDGVGRVAGALGTDAELVIVVVGPSGHPFAVASRAASRRWRRAWAAPARPPGWRSGGASVRRRSHEPLQECA